MLLLLLSLWTAFSFAADEEVEDYVGYIELKPFVANFGGTAELHFIKCEITIQVGSNATELAVDLHKDAIRNDILFLLMSQSVESMTEPFVQKVLAKKATLLVKQRLADEEGEEEEMVLNDLFFVSFVAQ
jgi:flagellar FliL protein